MKRLVELDVNGQRYDVIVSPRELLVDVLRKKVGTIGPKKGCGEGQCGACSVLLDGEPVVSCLTLAIACQGRKIVTVEGLAPAGRLTPLQQAFVEHGAIQCGYCTPGMLICAQALLDENPHPSEAQIRAALVGNLCRCTGYVKIVEAIQAAARGLEAGPVAAGAEPASARSTP
ncbi:MAG: (2Fe-2S)-binding protein [Burkholderiales bacterium]|nr:(2Fe-2S)-binding protein [Burkholderiales bacterium]